jgi:hypothetical protein
MIDLNPSKMNPILHNFRRNAQRWGLKIYKLTDPERQYQKETDYYKEAFGICHQLISNPSSTLLLSPISGKRYIKSDDNQIFIVIQKDTIDIVNHTYSYNIKVNGTNLFDRIVRIFDGEVENRREAMEAEIRKNVTHSLKSIYQNLSDEKRS